MTKKKQKLELTWVGKENRPRLEPRILREISEKSYHAAARVSEDDIFDNMLIHGDNLLALKALEADFSGKVRCVYIDPPFNTQQAFDHYDDGLEHSTWLALMRDRLELLHRLLSSDGTIFIHIDDHELAYLTVVADEIFGRENRVNTVTFKQGAATGHKSINPGLVTTSNYILIYAKDKNSWMPNRVFSEKGDRDKRYTRFIENIDEPFSDWRFCTLLSAFAAHKGLPAKGLKKAVGDSYESELAEFVIQNAEAVIRQARPDYKAVSAAARAMIDKSVSRPDEVLFLKREGFSDMYFIAGERLLFYADKLKKIDGKNVAGEPLTTIWDDLLSNNLHNEGGVKFPKGKKPEALIKRCLELATNRHDIVLDSFAGSGTTGAVAHKMGRRWIMAELRDQVDTHVLPRLQSVIDGNDTSGVSKTVGWKGGGGFRYFELAPSLLEKDKWGREVISKDYDPAMLAQAMCKLEGYRYEPSPDVWWQQGQSTETDFLYVTTQTLGLKELSDLSAEVGEGKSLLVLCGAWRGDETQFPNLTLRKIPNHIRAKCEWGHDDYSLNVANLPQPEPEQGEPQGALFAEEDDL
ncbi:site-specific DNA-methyltransferase [Altererythrobacter sp. ZODW24]|uniref:site-specific DNA-methyltransferase n=1 Tax=Altererythrobacter sp. ZODW24 TaxID=2185142 RepID=UPI000DF8236D|nr:site-specific DNA-methyltransferase [Altererythrobacter sp. ZODW24]